nr:neprilysin-like [Biomphalaria glabrata]
MAQLDNAMQDFTSQEIMINQSPLYFERLTTVLTNTPKRTVANYLIWRFIIFVLKTSALGEKYMNLLTNYNKVLFGTSSERARFRICGSYTTNVLRLAVGRMFIENNFDPDSKIIGLDMIKELQVAFDELLEDLDWMDDPTKVVAKEKNSYIAPKIGYPEEIKNDTYIEELYSKLEFDENFFENILIVERESYYENLRELRKPIDKEKWSIAPSTVNAFYNPLNNQILFPAGILQPPFFSKTYPKSLNFGGIGVVIGHEITHGFDDRGRLYDKYGNLAKWWSPDAENKFKAKAQCIIDQYSNFTVTDIHMKINGVNTQGENIADNGGLKQAYRAYRNWVKTQGKEEQNLPGLHFSNNQLFFINFAQLWCTLMTEGDALNRVRIGSHSPGEFRVVGSVQNSHDFATAFQCPVGSSMNPIHKCHVW